MYFQDDDLFLINRDSVSSTMEALTIKNIVNPVGTVEKPIIEKPTEQQGFPIKSTNIIRNYGAPGAASFTINLESHQDLDLIGSPGVDLNEPIVTTESYIPVTTTISRMEVTGDEYVIYFNPINYDFKYFEENELIHLVGESVEYNLDSIDPLKGTMTITSSSDFTVNIGKKFESKRELTGEAILEKYYVVDVSNDPAIPKFEYKCDIIDAEGEWVSGSHNNRKQRMTFDTTKPKGGSHIDLNNAVFVANEFEVDNSVLHLTDVIWRLNGREFNVPIVDKEAKQEWEVPPEAMIEDAVNVVTVTYIAGQNRATSERTEFIPKSNPIRLGNTVSLLNRIETFTTEVTALGL